MSNPLFGIAAACRLDITPGSSSYAAYFALVAQYQFGTPIINGRAPAELAAAIGVPLYEGPGDPGIAASVPGVVVVTFPYPTASVVVAGVPYPVSSSTPSGTLTGVNYVDANGVVHPDVDWQWNISVEPYLNTATGAPPVGTYDQQIVQYTGDGTANRLISTTLDLTKGVVAIWIAGGVQGDADINCFRHNGTAMLGTALIGSTTLQTTHGIMSFGATGFTVTDGSIVGVHFANGLNIKYTAIVLRDTTSDNRYLRVGTYTGLGANFVVAMGVHAGQAAVTGSFLPDYSGMSCSDASGSYIFSYSSPTTGSLSPVYQGATGATNMTFPGGDRVIATPGKASSLTHVWIGIGNGVYRSTDFVGDAATQLASLSPTQTNTNLIKSLGSASFGIGTDGQVNLNSRLYHYVALSVDATLAALFASFKGTGTASPPLVISGLGLTPTIAFARQYTTSAAGGLWRGPDHTTTHSSYMSGAGDDAAQGVRALGAGSVTVGTDVAPNGVDAYGWAFVGGTHTVTVPATPVYVKQSVSAAGDYGGSDGVAAGTAGCTSTVAPGAGPAPGGVGCSAAVAAGAGPAPGGSGCSATL